jgi:hypothetical protein
MEHQTPGEQALKVTKRRIIMVDLLHTCSCLFLYAGTAGQGVQVGVCSMLA